MRKNTNLALAISLLVFAASVFVPVATSRGAENRAMGKMIMAAKSASDHEAIAKEFEAQATEAKAKAAEHREMAEGYKKIGGALIEKLHLDRHCEALAKSYETAAREDAALAKAHRELAKSAK